MQIIEPDRSGFVRAAPKFPPPIAIAPRGGGVAVRFCFRSHRKLFGLVDPRLQQQQQQHRRVSESANGEREKIFFARPTETRRRSTHTHTHTHTRTRARTTSLLDSPKKKQKPQTVCVAVPRQRQCRGVGRSHRSAHGPRLGADAKMLRWISAAEKKKKKTFATPPGTRGRCDET